MAVKIWNGTHIDKRSRVERKRTVETTGAHPWKHKEAAATRYWTETLHGELSIDIDALFKLLGAKAMKNRSGKSALAGGIIKFKATKRVETDVRVEEHPLGERVRLVEA